MANQRIAATSLDVPATGVLHESWTRAGWVQATRLLLRDPRGAFATTVLLILLVFAFVVPLVSTTSPFESVRGERLLEPSLSHPFGTDELSRDLFIRNAVGLRATLIGGVFAVIAGWLCGITVGYIAGFRGGSVDSVISRFLDTLMAFPGILLAILLITLFGPGLTSLAAAVAIFNIPISARLARSAVMREGVRDYVLAARAMGCSGTRILWRHIAVNTFGILAVQLPISVVSSVLIMAALGFLGLGEQPPNPTLGGLLNDGRRFMRLAWWYLVAPATVLALLTLALNFLSDVLSELLDPARRGRA
ncbi:MAG: ABC transporter permease [Dehalococcoidia bacterium]|nr:ABC transporter permease [Dehalococcoidia bacterium]